LEFTSNDNIIKRRNKNMSKPTFTFGYDDLLVCYGNGLYTCGKVLQYENYEVTIIQDSETRKEGFEVRYVKLPLKIRYRNAIFDSMDGKRLFAQHEKEAKERCDNLIEEMLKYISPSEFAEWLNRIANHSYQKGRQSVKNDFKKLLERD
jgi:hypothetical protein